MFGVTEVCQVFVMKLATLTLDMFELFSIMAGHDSGAHHQFTGIAKYFNSYTITGRRNVSHDLLIQVV